MNISQVKKYYILIKVKLNNMPSLHNRLWEKLAKQKNKQTEDQGRNKVEVLKVLKPDIQQQLTIKDAIPEGQLHEKPKNGIEKITEIEKMANRKDLIYEARKYVYNY